MKKIMLLITILTLGAIALAVVRSRSGELE